MSNTYFQFKQFIIHQDKSALKVCTDSCIFGAWSTAFAKDAISILDIGSGTGLLSLMLAQKTEANFTSIEIDDKTFEQLQENISISPWENRIKSLHVDCRNFISEWQYDFIISNPPFYEKQVASLVKQEKQAKHDDTLTLDELLQSIQVHLKPEGKFALLFPYYRKAELLQAATILGFYPQECILLRPVTHRDYFRVAYLFSRTLQENVNEQILCIKDRNQTYTPAFRVLLKDYYLHL